MCLGHRHIVVKVALHPMGNPSWSVLVALRSVLLDESMTPSDFAALRHGMAHGRYVEIQWAVPASDDSLVAKIVRDFPNPMVMYPFQDPSDPEEWFMLARVGVKEGYKLPKEYVKEVNLSNVWSFQFAQLKREFGVKGPVQG